MKTRQFSFLTYSDWAFMKMGGTFECLSHICNYVFKKSSTPNAISSLTFENWATTLTVLYYCHYRWLRLSISTTIWWLAMKFCTDIHGPQRINPNDVGAPLTFPLAPPAGRIFYLSCEISQHLLNGSAQNFVQTFMSPKGWILLLFWTFTDFFFWFVVFKITHKYCLDCTKTFTFPTGWNEITLGIPLVSWFMSKYLHKWWHSHQPQLYFVFSAN